MRPASTLDVSLGDYPAGASISVTADGETLEDLLRRLLLRAHLRAPLVDDARLFRDRRRP
jgi:hypothetical protein